MTELQPFAMILRKQFPTLEVTDTKRSLTLRRGSQSVKLRVGEEIAQFAAGERIRRREEGNSYLDLGTGTLFVDEPGLFLYLRLPRPPARLSPYQCALLSALLERDAGWFERGLQGSQVDLIRQVRLELGQDVTPMGMSRFIDTIRTTGIVKGNDKPKLSHSQALRLVRESFRLSAVGKAETYAGHYSKIEPGLLESKLAGRFARGVAEVVGKETGAWIEPRDYLVDTSALSTLKESLGKPVSRSYQGTVVVVRPAMRVSLGLLTLGGPTIQPLLGLAEALRSDSLIARQACQEAWKKRERRWK